MFECDGNKVPCGGTKGSNRWDQPHNCDCRSTLWHDDKPAFKGCATALARSLPYWNDGQYVRYHRGSSRFGCSYS